MAEINNVKLFGYSFPDFQLTFNLASAMAATDKLGPVALDATAANRVKKCADGDTIHGMLLTYEDRTIEGTKVGAVAMKFAARFPVKSGDALAAGDIAVGAGSGEVRKWVSGTDDALDNLGQNLVTEVAGGFATVIKI